MRRAILIAVVLAVFAAQAFYSYSVRQRLLKLESNSRDHQHQIGQLADVATGQQTEIARTTKIVGGVIANQSSLLKLYVKTAKPQRVLSVSSP